MASKTLEARFEHLSVNDENDAPPTTMLKSKVSLISLHLEHMHITNLESS